MFSGFPWLNLSHSNYIMEYYISGCDWTQSEKEGSLEKKVPNKDIHSCNINWRAQKHLSTKDT